MSKRGKYIKPAHREILRAEVIASKQTSTGFARVTLGGEDLRRFTHTGQDQWFRLFLPAPDGTLRLPTLTSNLWYAQYMLIPQQSRPLCRNYTVRAFRPGSDGAAGAKGPELDIDFALHRDSEGQLGPAAQWALDARPGDQAAILDEGYIFQPPTGSEWNLLVGDETALPGIMGILDSYRSSAPLRLAPLRVIVELAQADDIPELPDLPGIEASWACRDQGRTALDLLASAPLPRTPGYACLAGGHQLVTRARRDLVARGMPKQQIVFTGYWR
ncbi:siderophore-interacting protein [Lolliginicoccus suaedae]|uniref:siderophore-interacting protein n=1 Tax=Lolliginicoccus suaedae TaxID=2605429 RepID=UPI0011EF3419|nr:siderophore-interacting protein [Lolliginicoccus suaedae]